MLVFSVTDLNAQQFGQLGLILFARADSYPVELFLVKQRHKLPKIIGLVHTKYMLLLGQGKDSSCGWVAFTML